MPDAGQCGDGIRNATEQCDDGNLINLDGCGAACRFELTQRVNWLQLQQGVNTVCTANAFGGAFTNVALSTLQPLIDTGVTNGTTSLLFPMLQFTDLTVANQAPTTLHFVNGTPPSGFDGGIDTWFTASPAELDVARLPLTTLPAAVNSHLLTAGPGTISPTIALFAGPAPIKMSSTRLSITTNASSTPLTSSGGSPGHLASENVDPSLTCLTNAGQPTANGAGRLCANLGAASLAAIPLSTAITQNCTQYTVNNSLLDLVVGGCTAFGVIVVVNATQPDQVDAQAPIAGAGGPYRLSASGANRVVDTCRDRNNAIVNLQLCLNAAAYSSSFNFTTLRAIAK